MKESHARGAPPCSKGRSYRGQNKRKKKRNEKTKNRTKEYVSFNGQIVKIRSRDPDTSVFSFCLFLFISPSIRPAFTAQNPPGNDRTKTTNSTSKKKNHKKIKIGKLKGREKLKTFQARKQQSKKARTQERKQTRKCSFFFRWQAAHGLFPIRIEFEL